MNTHFQDDELLQKLHNMPKHSLTAEKNKDIIAAIQVSAAKRSSWARMKKWMVMGGKGLVGTAIVLSLIFILFTEDGSHFVQGVFKSFTQHQAPTEHPLPEVIEDRPIVELPEADSSWAYRPMPSSIPLNFTPVEEHALHEGTPDEKWILEQVYSFDQLHQEKISLNLYIDTSEKPYEHADVYAYLEDNGKLLELGLVSSFGIQDINLEVADYDYYGHKVLFITGALGAAYSETKVIGFNESSQAWMRLLAEGSYMEKVDLTGDHHAELIFGSSGSAYTYALIYRWNIDHFELANVAESIDDGHYYYAFYKPYQMDRIFQLGRIGDGEDIYPDVRIYQYKDGHLVHPQDGEGEVLYAIPRELMKIKPTEIPYYFKGNTAYLSEEEYTEFKGGYTPWRGDSLRVAIAATTHLLPREIYFEEIDDQLYAGKKEITLEDGIMYKVQDYEEGMKLVEIAIPDYGRYKVYLEFPLADPALPIVTKLAFIPY